MIRVEEMRKNTDLKKEVKYYKWKMRQKQKYGKIEVWRKGTMDEM